MVKLSFEDRIKSLLPPWLYYPYKLVREGRGAEPELAILREIVPVGCTAIDVGANRGYYSWALAAIADHVEAFEPNPVLASFARAKLRTRARIHNVALSDREGPAILYVPRKRGGVSLHIIGNLGNVYAQDGVDEIEVQLATLDGYDFRNVGFIKIDVEGSEMDVIAGARNTISRDRPNMLIELLAGIHGDVEGRIHAIKSTFSYDAWIIIGREKVDASLVLSEPAIARKTSNVLFTPK